MTGEPLKGQTGPTPRRGDQAFLSSDLSRDVGCSTTLPYNRARHTPAHR